MFFQMRSTPAARYSARSNTATRAPRPASILRDAPGVLTAYLVFFGSIARTFPALFTFFPQIVSQIRRIRGYDMFLKRGKST